MQPFPDSNLKHVKFQVFNYWASWVGTKHSEQAITLQAENMQDRLRKRQEHRLNIEHQGKWK